LVVAVVTAVDALPALVAAMVSDVTTDPVSGVPMASILPLDRGLFTRDNPARDQLLDAFIASRLLTADGDGAHIVVRPTHEALFRIWPRAVELVTELGPMLRVRRALAPLLRDWQAAAEPDKPRHLEISPALLEGALQLAARLDVDAAMAAFIAACAAAAEARRREAAEEQERRLRDAEALAAARRRTAQRTGAGLILALLLAGLAGWQWRMAGVQRDRAEQALASATDAANSLVFDLAQKFRATQSVPVAVVKDILDRASQLQARLLSQGNPSAALRRSHAEALMEMSATLLDQGQTQGALDAAKQAQGVFQSLLDQQPANIDWQRELSVSFEKVGDVQVARGNLPEALKSYQAGLAIADRLAKSDPGNAGWQRDLSVSFEKVGDVQEAQGNLPEAMKSYQAEFAILDRLAKSDPGNAGWQRSLAVSFEKVGNVQVAQGNLPEAMKSYQAGLAIRDRLAQSDPGNAGWQRDLPVSLEKVGDVQVAQGNLPEAMKSYRASLAIRDRLAQSDPGNAGWQRRSLGVVQQGRRRAGGAGQSARGDEILSGRPRHSRSSGAIRSRQCRLAARSLGVVRQCRRRAGGAGQSAGGAEILSGRPGHRRSSGESRSRQCRLAARSRDVLWQAGYCSLEGTASGRGPRCAGLRAADHRPSAGKFP